MIQQRNFWTFLVLDILTCGLYGLYFWYVWNEDVNRICEGDGQYVPNYIVVILLGFVTCGIYTYYWMYKQGNRLQANAGRYGVQFKENGNSLLLWSLLGYLTCSLTVYYSYYLMITMVNWIAPGFNGWTGNASGSANYGGAGNYQSYGYSAGGNGRIVCLCGPEPQRVTELADAQTLILGQDGRMCNHVIMGFAVEAKHCSISYRRFDNMYLVTDHSMRGTYRASDDSRLRGEEMTELPAGSVIYLGDRSTMYRLG